MTYVVTSGTNVIQPPSLPSGTEGCSRANRWRCRVCAVVKEESQQAYEIKLALPLILEEKYSKLPLLLIQ